MFLGRGSGPYIRPGRNVTTWPVDRDPEKSKRIDWKEAKTGLLTNPGSSKVLGAKSDKLGRYFILFESLLFYFVDFLGQTKSKSHTKMGRKLSMEWTESSQW